MLNEEKGRIYDELVNATVCNIYSMAKTTKNICLENFNFRNKEHLFFLEVALMTREIYHFPIYIETDWLTLIKINWKIRKAYQKVSKMTKETSRWQKNMDEILDYEREYGNLKLHATEKDKIFADIYKVYYERM